MQILYTRLVDESERDGTRCLAFIDLEFSPDLRLYGLRLMRMPDGEHRLYAPLAGKRRSSTFSSDMAQRLTRMALRAWEDARDAA